MNTVLGEKIVAAKVASENNLNSFVWKGARKEINGKKYQEEIKLVDASEEDLKKFYSHCKSMLYNKDEKNPGRYVLIDIIKDQRARCNTELFLRYLSKPDPITCRPAYGRFNYMQDIKSSLNNPENLEQLPRNLWKTTPIKVLTNGLPSEFENLPIELVIDGCLDGLGRFDRKHITFNFLMKLGVWFTPQELKELSVDEHGNKILDSDGKPKNKFLIAKERLGLRNDLLLSTNGEKGLLTYTELRSMIRLQSNKYSYLTTDQLTVLRDKVLFKLEDEAIHHAEQWKERMSQIERVAEARGIDLND